MSKLNLSQRMDAAINRTTSTVQPVFAPEKANYFDLVQDRLQLNEDELKLLAQNGFVVSDRLAFKNFTTAYGYAYWKDLPVLITTDSILHSIHQSYEQIMCSVEGDILVPQLKHFFTTIWHQLRQDWQNNREPRLHPIYQELDIYVAVGLTLLHGRWIDEEQPAHRQVNSLLKRIADKQDTAGRFIDIKAMQPLVRWICEANQIKTVVFFGGEARRIDFSLFKPRGRYADDASLAGFFRAMTWLGQIDFRLVEYLPRSSQPILQIEHLAAAVLLKEFIDKSGMRPVWNNFDALLTELIGHSDNIRLDGLDSFMLDAGIQTANEVLDYPNPDHLLHLLGRNPYGDQQITGHILARHIDNPSEAPMPRPASFALMGQRFTIDAYLMSNLVYDRLEVNGERVPRALPSPLDVMYILGNDRALTHLQDELAKYGYKANLDALREAMGSFDLAFWSDTLYNRWLNILRTLNHPHPQGKSPRVTHSPAWADKMLHTQLASWAQLRHDFLLYVKQTFTGGGLICSYPSGYVEPYPKFFTAVADYARRGLRLFEGAMTSSLIGNKSDRDSVARTHKRIFDYFSHLADVSTRLGIMAEKELRHESFTEKETIFLKSVVVRQDNIPRVYGGPGLDDIWDGWYLKLFLFAERAVPIIADVHTNPTDDPASPLYPPRVLHVATGLAATQVFIGDTDEGENLYVGPAFTYFEVIGGQAKSKPLAAGTQIEDKETDEFKRIAREVSRSKAMLFMPPTRLNDYNWRRQLANSPYPQPPAWTNSFRLPTAQPPEGLKVPLKALMEGKK